MSEQVSTEPSKPDAARADVGLVCALPLEIADFLGRCSKMKTYSGGRFTFRGGIYKDIRVAVVESGPGRDRARRATEALLDAHSPRWVISTGFCGGLVKEMKVAQIVVSNAITTIAGDDLNIDVGMSSDPGRGLHVGRTLTVDKMVRTIAEKCELAELSRTIAVDMESHAVASICRDRKTRCLVIRAVSDDLSADLPAEVLSLVGETGAVRVGAVIGALWKRPTSYKDMWRLRENAMLASERLANFLDGVITQLHAAP